MCYFKVAMCLISGTFKLASGKSVNDKLIIACPTCFSVRALAGNNLG